MLPETFLRYGQPDPPAELIPLRAGPLTLLYDAPSGMVRRIKLGEREVLRGIYAAVRDRNWDTVPVTIRETIRVVHVDSFRLEFTAEHQQGDIHFAWQGKIRGEADGTLRYEFNGESKSTFLKNRIGFCVLHPIGECAGARAKQFRVDGTEIECRFPEWIEPQIFGRSSFQQLRGVAHEVMPGVWARTDFEGDTFEMEDQRNWTDASFKTYCTPLAVPFPIEIAKGQRIRQSVTLRLSGTTGEFYSARTKATVIQPELVTVTIPETPTGCLPAIGLGVASHGEALTANEVATLRQLRPAHLRVDLLLGAADSTAALERAVREAEQLNARLELALHLPRTGEVDVGELLPIIQNYGSLIGRILALRQGEPATTPATLAWVRKQFGGLSAVIGAGSDSNFCELNRELALGHLALDNSDFLFWSINPQVHATDHLSIMETLEAQSATVRSARALAGNRQLMITPVTLRQRFNPVATSTESTLASDELPPQVDPRQLSQFAAAWTLGSVAALASAGVTSITYFETTDARGVMERASGPALPAKFPSTPGQVFPLFQVFADLAGFRDFSLGQSSHLTLCAIALFEGSILKRVLVANLSDQMRAVQISGAISEVRRVQIEAYGVVRLDYGG